MKTGPGSPLNLLRRTIKVMDPKLLQWAGGDIAKVNVDPKKKQKPYAKYAAGAA